MNFPCARTDAVLAHHLDGDLDDSNLHEHGYGFACGETLHAHLRECRLCQATLQRARRLDAELATAAGTDVAHHPAQVGTSWARLTHRWFAAVTETTAAAPRRGYVDANSAADAEAGADSTPAHLATPTSHRGLAPRPLAPAQRAWLGALAAAALAAFTLGPWLVPAARVRPAEHSLAPAATAVAAHTAILSLDRPMAAGQTRAAVAGSPPAARPLVVGSARLVAGERREQATAPTPNELAKRAEDTRRPSSERLAAVRALLVACRWGAPEPRRACRELVRMLAGAGDRTSEERELHVAMLDEVRDQPSATGLLAADLVAIDAPGLQLERDHQATLVVAARLGVPDLDRKLARVLRRHRDAIEVVASALRCGVRPSGGARLLLDHWQETNRRQREFPESTAMAWFRAQPPTLFGELAIELAAARGMERRVCCLLALGCAADDAVVPVLLTHVHSAHHDEAHAAAFALAHLPRAVLLALPATALAAPLDDGDLPLLRAALARADLPMARPWLEALALRGAERDLLHRGSLAAFPEVVGWFRDRSHLGD